MYTRDELTEQIRLASVMKIGWTQRAELDHKLGCHIQAAQAEKSAKRWATRERSLLRQLSHQS